jgi:2-oxoglutarate ferredoxin oxidoreductase subunit beta
MNNEFNIKTEDNTWCPGCGNFMILKGMEEVLAENGYKPKDVLFVSGIGQAAKMPHYINGHGYNTLHGRALPSAMGAHLANSDLLTIVNTGDGDNYSEGGNHFLHAIRRNMNIVHLIHDNQVYGLTKGQGSPTTPKGRATSVYADGVRIDEINPIESAIAIGATFVARTFSNDLDHLKQTIKAAIEHDGYSIVDILQPCPSFNMINTFQWYKERIYKIDETHNPYDKFAAYKLAQEFGDEGVPIGVFYKDDSKPSYLKRLTHIEKPLIQYKTELSVLDEIFESFI